MIIQVGPLTQLTDLNISLIYVNKNGSVKSQLLKPTSYSATILDEPIQRKGQIVSYTGRPDEDYFPISFDYRGFSPFKQYEPFDNFVFVVYPNLTELHQARIALFEPKFEALTSEIPISAIERYIILGGFFDFRNIEKYLFRPAGTMFNAPVIQLAFDIA